MGHGRCWIEVRGEHRPRPLVILPDDRADVAYGLLERGRGVPLPGDVSAAHSYSMSQPSAPVSGRHWIGARVAECDMLPISMRARVYTATEASTAADLPRSDSVGEARASWEHFAAWCKRRGVDLGTGGLYVVADYD